MDHLRREIEVCNENRQRLREVFDSETKELKKIIAEERESARNDLKECKDSNLNYQEMLDRCFKQLKERSEECMEDTKRLVNLSKSLIVEKEDQCLQHMKRLANGYQSLMVKKDDQYEMCGKQVQALLNHQESIAQKLVERKNELETIHLQELNSLRQEHNRQLVESHESQRQNMKIVLDLVNDLNKQFNGLMGKQVNIIERMMDRIPQLNGQQLYAMVEDHKSEMDRKYNVDAICRSDLTPITENFCSVHNAISAVTNAITSM